jgi:hypothetical protein
MNLLDWMRWIKTRSIQIMNLQLQHEKMQISHSLKRSVTLVPAAIAIPLYNPKRSGIDHRYIVGS